jgi:hypothetical protein
MHTRRHWGWPRLGLTGLLVAAFSALLLLGSGSAGATIGSSLYDQNNNMGELGFPSATLDNVALADDFVVPAATSWQIGTIKTTGLDQADLTSVKVTIYSDSSNAPGTPVYTRTLSSGSFTDEPGAYSTPGGKLTIPVDVTLASGHYWLSVQGDSGHVGNGWYWETRTVVANHAAMALYPARGCTSWTDLTTCWNEAGSLDLMFALYGPSTADILTPTNGAALTATEGAELSGGTLGAFTDDNTSAAAANFTANVDWGDGMTGTGTVTGSSGNFTVTGSHTYTQAGDYNIVTNVSGNGGTAEINTSVHVADVPLTISQVRVNVKPTHGSPDSTATLTVKFNDANPYTTANDYSTSTIDWGDGKPLSTPTFAAQGKAWSGTATHDYVRGFTYTITVTINAPGGANDSIQKTITVR